MERRLSRENAEKFMAQMEWSPVAKGVSPEVKLFLDSHAEIIYNEVSRKMSDWVSEHYKKFMGQRREYDLYVKIFEMVSKELSSRDIAYEYARSVEGGTVSVLSCIEFIVDKFRNTISNDDELAS